jgi:hypothetical protein
VNGAIAAWRKALECDNRLVEAHYNLGSALFDQGDLEGAEASFRQAIVHDPRCIEAHGNLGTVLLRQGRFPEAEKATRTGLNLMPAGDARRTDFSRQVQRCEALLALDKKLLAVLLRTQKPGSAAEALDLAALCQRPYKRLYHASARLYGDAFAAEPTWADDLAQRHRYYAACAAALAAAGQGQDAGHLDDRERSRLRTQAHDWLRADLAAYTRLVENKDARSAVQQRLTDWLGDASLVSVRDEKALAALPEAERATWRQLRAEVAALLEKVGGKP